MYILYYDSTIYILNLNIKLQEKSFHNLRVNSSRSNKRLYIGNYLKFNLFIVIIKFFFQLHINFISALEIPMDTEVTNTNIMETASNTEIVNAEIVAEIPETNSEIILEDTNIFHWLEEPIGKYNFFFTYILIIKKNLCFILY